MSCGRPKSKGQTIGRSASTSAAVRPSSSSGSLVASSSTTGGATSPIAMSKRDIARQLADDQRGR